MPSFLIGFLATPLFVFLLVLVAPATAEPLRPEPIKAVRLNPGTRIVLDGTLSHKDWGNAPIHDNFFEKNPTNGAKPKFETHVQVMFDDEALYIGIIAKDEDSKLIRAPLTRHDTINPTQDSLTVFIDPLGKSQSAQFFRVNASGSTADGIYTAADDNENLSPDYDFDVAVARRLDGYSAVFKVPFSSLRYPTNSNPNWRILVTRQIPRQDAFQVTSALIPNEASNLIAYQQDLIGLKLPDSHGYLNFRPSLTMRTTRNYDEKTYNGVHRSVDLAADVKWHPRDELVIDATISPDFSQVAIDTPQLVGNTRFAQNLPEKRPFFFESSDLLQSPTDAIYTRSFTQPRWGIRATWRENAIAGTIFALKDKGGGVILLPGPYGTARINQPAFNSLTTRIQGDFSKVQFGGTFTERNYKSGQGSNIVTGPDFIWTPTETLQLQGQLLHSITTAQPNSDGDLSKGKAVPGNRFYVRIRKTGDSSSTSFTIDEISSNFRHDGGFVVQNDYRSLEFRQGFGWRKIGPLNEFWLNFIAKNVRDRTTGKTIEQSLNPGVWMATSGGTTWELQYRRLSAMRTTSESELLRDNYLYSNISVPFNSVFQQVTLEASLGKLPDVAVNKVRPGGNMLLSAKLRPFMNLEVEPTLSVAWLKRDNELSYRESVFQLLAVWHFDGRTSLRTILQRSNLHRKQEAGVLGEDDSNKNLSLTYTQRYSSSNVLYIGITQADSILNKNLRNGEIFFKFQFDGLKL